MYFVLIDKGLKAYANLWCLQRLHCVEVVKQVAGLCLRGLWAFYYNLHPLKTFTTPYSSPLLPGNINILYN